MLIPSMRYSISSFIVLLIVITLALLVIHFLYTVSMILDKKEFKFTRKDKKRCIGKKNIMKNSDFGEEKNNKMGDWNIFLKIN